MTYRIGSLEIAPGRPTNLTPAAWRLGLRTCQATTSKLFAVSVSRRVPTVTCVSTNDCRIITAKYDIWSIELRQVAAFHREITAFCRYLMSY